jgi:hypothetical protein
MNGRQWRLLERMNLSAHPATPPKVTWHTVLFVAIQGLFVIAVAMFSAFTQIMARIVSIAQP